MTKDEALKLALEALETCDAGDYSTGHVIYPSFDVDAVNKAIDAIDQALAQPEQEPVALFKWLPEGATHIGRISVRTAAGGALAMTTRAFKYDSAVLKVYVTDNDNEYPGWRDAKDCFFHLNFPVLPLYTTPPQLKPVAWGVFEGKLHDMFFTEAEAVEMSQLKGTHAEVKPLYTKENA